MRAYLSVRHVKHVEEEAELAGEGLVVRVARRHVLELKAI